MSTKKISQAYEIQKIKHETALKIAELLTAAEKEIDKLDGEGYEAVSEILEMLQNAEE